MRHIQACTLLLCYLLYSSHWLIQAWVDLYATESFANKLINWSTNGPIRGDSSAWTLIKIVKLKHQYLCYKVNVHTRWCLLLKGCFAFLCPPTSQALLLSAMPNCHETTAGPPTRETLENTCISCSCNLLLVTPSFFFAGYLNSSILLYQALAGRWKHQLFLEQLLTPLMYYMGIKTFVGVKLQKSHFQKPLKNMK